MANLTFRLIAQGPAEDRFEHPPRVEITGEEALAYARANRKKWHKPAPRKCGRHGETGRDLEMLRAAEYAEIMTGKPAAAVFRFGGPFRQLFRDDFIFDHVEGEKHPRIRAVKMADGSLYQIPHWDWTGHLQTIDDARLPDEGAAA